MADLVGTSLDKYHIVEPLGQGGMAQVYKAAQIDLARYATGSFEGKGYVTS